MKDELKALAANVVRLSHLLTRDRGSLPAAYLKDAALRKAYQVYFLPPNLRKIHAPLRDLANHPEKLLDRDRLRIFDLGCGPGTSLLGVLEFFAGQEKRPQLEFVALDHVSENLTAAEEMFVLSRNEKTLAASLQAVRSSIESAAQHVAGTFDLVILSNVLNELFVHDEGRIGKRTALVKDILFRSLAEDGSCIIIEPALRETSREMLQVRDGLLAAGFTIYAPCLCQARCPALENPKDWCHEDIPWDAPELIRELDRLTALRKDSLKFSYLVIRKDSRSLRDLSGEGIFRVVSEPLVSKGKIEFYLCDTNGRRLVTRLDKDRTALNESFGTLDRGDIVGFDGLIDEGGRFRVAKETGVALRQRIR